MSIYGKPGERSHECLHMTGEVAEGAGGWCLEIWIDDRISRVEHAEYIYGIRYCPWCGQKLPTEGVEDA